MAITCIRLLADPLKIKACRRALAERGKVFDEQAERLQLAGNASRLRILYLLAIEPELCPCDLSDILSMTVQAVSQHLKKLKDGGQLERNPGSRFAYIDHGQDSVTLFVDGQEFALGPALATLARVLCRERILDSRRLQAALSGDDAWALLLDLLNEGFLVIYEG